MLARRDTYHDYVTDWEQEEDRGALRRKAAELVERSGFPNCPGLGNFTFTRDENARIVKITAWANSSTWTGRPR